MGLIKVTKIATEVNEQVSKNIGSPTHWNKKHRWFSVSTSFLQTIQKLVRSTPSCLCNWWSWALQNLVCSCRLVVVRSRTTINAGIHYRLTPNWECSGLSPRCLSRKRLTTDRDMAFARMTLTRINTTKLMTEIIFWLTDGCQQLTK